MKTAVSSGGAAEETEMDGEEEWGGTKNNMRKNHICRLRNACQSEEDMERLRMVS